MPTFGVSAERPAEGPKVGVYGVLGPPGLAHDSLRTPNVHIPGPRRFEHHQNSTKKTKREEERMKTVAGEGKKARNFGPPPFGAPTLRGPTLWGPAFSNFGPILAQAGNGQKVVWAKSGQKKMVQLGEVSAGRHVLDGACLGPGDLKRQKALEDPTRRPPAPGTLCRTALHSVNLKNGSHCHYLPFRVFGVFRVFKVFGVFGVEVGFNFGFGLTKTTRNLKTKT